MGIEGVDDLKSGGSAEKDPLPDTPTETTDPNDGGDDPTDTSAPTEAPTQTESQSGPE
jgi:hypothetical protein